MIKSDGFGRNIFTLLHKSSIKFNLFCHYKYNNNNNSSNNNKTVVEYLIDILFPTK